MKSLPIFLLCFLFLFTQTVLYAALPPASSPSAAPTEPPETREVERIERIKEMVASRAAELQLVDKKGIMGIVQGVSNTQITLTDIRQNTRIVDTDELTKFQDGPLSSKSFGISDIKKDDLIGAVGLYNKDIKRLLSRVVIKIKPGPIMFIGNVTQKDPKEFTLIVAGDKTKIKTVGIEISTKTRMYTQEGTLQKSGFSKILVGQRVYVVGTQDPKEQNTIDASRIIHFEDTLSSSPSPTLNKQ